MMFTFNSCRFVVCFLSLALSVNADTIRGALQRKLTYPTDNVLLRSLGSNGSREAPIPPHTDTYTAIGIVGLTGNLYLDARSGADTPNGDSWTFTFPAAFTTAALSQIVFVRDLESDPPVLYRADDANAAKYQEYAAKVTWLVSGPITLGASSFVGGTMKSGATITLGATARSGDLCADAAIVLGAAAISLSITGDAAITVGAGGTCGPIDAGAAITVGAGSFIASLTAGGATTIGATVVCEIDNRPWTTCTNVILPAFVCPDLS
jgi:hypothetical protein